MAYPITPAALKKNAVWIALAVTLLLAVLAGPDESRIDSVASPRPAPAASKPAKPAPTITPAALPDTWPLRPSADLPIRDLFGLKAAPPDPRQARPSPVSVPLSAPPPPPPEEQFAFAYFGQLVQEGRKTAFFHGPGGQVMTVQEGAAMDPAWKLLSIEPQQVTLLHTSTGRQFQLSTTHTP